MSPHRHTDDPEILRRRLTELETALERERAVIDTVIRHTQEASLLLTPEGRLNHFSAAAADMLHLTPNDIGTDFLAADIVPRLRSHFDALHSSNAGTMTWEASISDGPSLVAVAMSAMRDDRDRLAGALVAIRDISLWQRDEHTKRSILNVLSHELRTPLTVLHGYAQALLDCDELGSNAEVREMIESLLRAELRLEHVVNELVAFLEQQHGKAPLNLVPVPMTDFLQGIVEWACEEAADAGVEVVNLVPDGLPTMPVDPDRLESAIREIIRNSIKFTPAGGYVRVSAAVEGDQLRVAVSDTGEGIAPEHLQHVFTSFYQQPQHTEARAEGMGLGLSLVRLTVGAHGGTITAVSEPEEGSLFTIRLPLTGPDEALSLDMENLRQLLSAEQLQSLGLADEVSAALLEAEGDAGEPSAAGAE